MITCDICSRENTEKFNECCGLKWCFSCDCRFGGRCAICERDELNLEFNCDSCPQIITAMQSNYCVHCEKFYCVNCVLEDYDAGDNPYCSNICACNSLKADIIENSSFPHPWEWLNENDVVHCNLCNTNINSITARLCYCCKEIYCHNCLYLEEEYNPPCDYGHVCKNQYCMSWEIIAETLYDTIDKI